MGGGVAMLVAGTCPERIGRLVMLETVRAYQPLLRGSYLLAPSLRRHVLRLPRSSIISDMHRVRLLLVPVSHLSCDYVARVPCLRPPAGRDDGRGVGGP